MCCDNYIDLYKSGKYKEVVEKINDNIINNNYDIVDIYNLSVACIKTHDYDKAIMCACYSFIKGNNEPSCIFNLLHIVQTQHINKQLLQGLFGIEFKKHYENEQTSYEEICDIYEHNKIFLGLGTKEECINNASLAEKFIKTKFDECQSYIDEIAENIQGVQNICIESNNETQLSIHEIKDLEVIEIRNNYIIVYKYSLFNGELCSFIDEYGELDDRYILEKTRNTKYFQQKLVKKYPKAKVINIA